MALSPDFAVGGFDGESNDAGAADQRLEKIVRRLAGDGRRVAGRDDGRAAAYHLSQWRRQNDAIQPDHGRLATRCGCDFAVRGRSLSSEAPPACASWRRQNLPDHYPVPEGFPGTQHRSGAAWAVERALERVPP